MVESCRSMNMIGHDWTIDGILMDKYLHVLTMVPNHLVRGMMVEVPGAPGAVGRYSHGEMNSDKS